MRQFLASSIAAASTLISLVSAAPDCSNILADGANFDITALKGPHSVYQIDTEDTSTPANTTFTFDLCKTLHHYRGPGETGCQRGSWACGFKRDYDPETGKTAEDIKESWSVAGTFTSTGKSLEDKYERLSSSSSDADAEQGLEGVRMHLSGGKVQGAPTKMIATLQCDKDAHKALRRKRHDRLFSRSSKEDAGDDSDDGDDNKDEDLGSETSKPEFVTYRAEPIQGDKKDNINYVLRIRWKTVHACEDEVGKHGKGSGSHWGFFTWFIIVLFLLVAAYLIFGSWLNYNRHGARGWDLLPHGDTIRDVPYLLKDWGRAIVDTVQGTHSRGGYNQI